MNISDISVPYQSNQYRKSGVYMICSLLHNLAYVGSTRYLGVRTQCHMAQLRHGKHTSDLMQLHFDIYGDLTVRVIEECPVGELRSREQYWFDQLQSYLPENGFNLQPSAEGKVQGERAKEKLRLVKLGVKLGSVHSAEQKEKWSAIRRGADNANAKKVVQFAKDGTVIKVWDYIKQAADALGITKSNISSACAGRLKTSGGFRWEYFSPKCWLEV